MDLFQDVGHGSSADESPGELHAIMMEIKAAYPAKSMTAIVTENERHAVPASFRRRTQRGLTVQGGEGLKTEAELKVLDSKRLGLDFDATAVRESILRCTMTDLK